MVDNPTPWAGGGGWFGATWPGGGDAGDPGGASSERARGRLTLRGELDEVGLDDLLGALAARGRSCMVGIRTPTRRGEIWVERGRVTRVCVDGGSASADVGPALAELRALSRGVFDVLSLDEASSRPASRTPSSGLHRAVRTGPAMLEGDATEVALAAAAMNACGAYTRRWLGAKIATSITRGVWLRLAVVYPALDAFRISPDGMVTVSGVERAKSAIPAAVAAWVFAVFDAASALNGEHFQSYHVPEMLGGLMRLLDKGGWGEAFRSAGGVR